MASTRPNNMVFTNAPRELWKLPQLMRHAKWRFSGTAPWSNQKRETFRLPSLLFAPSRFPLQANKVRGEREKVTKSCFGSREALLLLSVAFPFVVGLLPPTAKRS